MSKYSENASTPKFTTAFEEELTLHFCRGFKVFKPIESRSKYLVRLTLNYATCTCVHSFQSNCELFEEFISISQTQNVAGTFGLNYI